MALRNDDWNYAVDARGLVQILTLELNIDEAIEIVDNSTIIERSRYGYEAFVRSDKGNMSTFFRFENETTRSKESAAEFIRKNWEVQA